MRLLAETAHDPICAPEVLLLRDQIREWRFYDHFRCDRDAPARQAHIGSRTVVLSHDGSDFAAAWQTIREIGDIRSLDEAVDDDSPGASVEVSASDGRFELLSCLTGRCATCWGATALYTTATNADDSERGGSSTSPM